MINQLELLFKQELQSKLPSKITQAMAYSLLGKGKRVRPQFIFKMLEDYGVQSQESLYLAAALESIHTYSLIHDDLPALDNDDLRRFEPTNHIVFGEDIAILAGDGLLTLAFSFLAKARVDYRYFEILSRNAGIAGMILGQEIDILDDITSLEDLIESYRLKTGALFSCAFEFAVLQAKDEKNIAQAQKLGELLGVAFQIQDDLLEVTSSPEVIGKSNDSDKGRDIATITRYLSIEETAQLLNDYFNEIEEIITQFNFKSNALSEYVKTLQNRSL